MSTTISGTINLLQMPLIEARNYRLDNLYTYYASIASAESGWLTLKAVPNIEMDIKLRVPLTDSQGYIKPLPYNYAYMRVYVNGSTTSYTPYLFYIREYRHVGNDTIELSLHLDTLNTYAGWQDLLSPRTFILRQHEDRFKLVDSVYFPVIDPIDEGINLPKYRFEKASIEGTQASGKKWYLIYRTPDATASDYNASNPIETSLVCEDALLVSNATSSGLGSDVILQASSMSIGGGYYLIETASPDFSFTPESGTTYTNDTTASYPRLFMTLFYTTDAATIKVVNYYGTLTATGWRITTIEALEPASDYTYITFHKASYMYRLGSLTTDVELIEASANLYQLNAGTTAADAVYSAAFSTIDRTDPTIVKIVECPYCPSSLGVSAGLYYVSGYTFSQSRMEWVKDDYATINGNAGLTNDSESDFIPALETAVTPGAARSLVDPKIWHSQFTEVAYRFDNFSYLYRYERLSIDFDSLDSSMNPYSVRFTFYASTDVSSSFLFYVRPYYAAYAEMQDENAFSGYFVSGRNNETPIFTNAYLNYMRTGYNFDIKTKNMQNILAVINSLGGVAASAAAGSLAGPVGTIASGAIGSVVSLTNALGSIEQREIAFEKNLVNLQHQAVSVAGSGDLSLFDVYSGFLDATLFRISEENQSRIDDLFYYFGYARNLHGTPNFTSRIYFNFVQCEPDFKPTSQLYIGLTAIPKFALDDIADKLRAGITDFHYYDSAYHLNQTEENLETSLL